MSRRVAKAAAARTSSKPRRRCNELDGKRWLQVILQRNPNDRKANQALLDYYAQRNDPESQRRAEALRQALQTDAR